jgi:hypothetical protein
MSSNPVGALVHSNKVCNLQYILVVSSSRFELYRRKDGWGSGNIACPSETIRVA